MGRGVSEMILRFVERFLNTVEDFYDFIFVRVRFVGWCGDLSEASEIRASRLGPAFFKAGGKTRRLRSSDASTHQFAAGRAGRRSAGGGEILRGRLLPLPRLRCR